MPSSIVEVVVKDGGTSGLREFIERRFPWVQLIDDSDAGIYDAMNVGLRATKGQWVWFLNGGDEAAMRDAVVFLGSLERSLADIVMFDYLRRESSGDRYRRCRAPAYIWHALPTSHQAIVYRGTVARSASYSTEYRVASDYEFTARLMKSGAVAEVAHQAISRFFPGGLSTESQWQVASDALRVQRDVLGSSWPRRFISGGRHYGIALWRSVSKLTVYARGRVRSMEQL
ncbi:PGL/p-HBAD biosynthesis glycosyltransferase [mine drainage metagenome]|uniref:PGL/p-HBAD biosynthesis glycosyltransferase n=1 Tax=mine drainage metagenome TaxID=410659 RepID=A0A1J5R600_9ZZZZ